jgi:hypothetical protein
MNADGTLMIAAEQRDGCSTDLRRVGQSQRPPTSEQRHGSVQQRMGNEGYGEGALVVLWAHIGGPALAILACPTLRMLRFSLTNMRAVRPGCNHSDVTVVILMARGNLPVVWAGCRNMFWGLGLRLSSRVWHAT